MLGLPSPFPPLAAAWCGPQHLRRSSFGAHCRLLRWFIWGDGVWSAHFRTSNGLNFGLCYRLLARGRLAEKSWRFARTELRRLAGLPGRCKTPNQP